MKMSASIPSNICLNPLNETLSATSLKTLSSIVSTCLGPHGKLKLLQNASGGCSIITSSSQRIFNHLSIKNIFTKIISSATTSQLRSFNDNGFLCSLLALKLIHNSVPLEYPLSLVGALHGSLGKMYIDCLNSESNMCTFDVDISNLTHLKCIVHAILSSKPGCMLTVWDRTHLCNLLLEAFLNVIPSQLLDNCNISLFFCGGKGAKFSRLYDGLLVRVSETAIGNVNTSGPFKTALFTTSLLGDVPVKVVEGASSCTVLGAILKSVECVVEKVIAAGVHIVFCQKVVHPQLKKQLQKAKILVLDRLGSETTKYVQYISGGNSNSSLFSEVMFGTISRIQKQRVGQNHFLLLHNDDAALYSLVICNYSEETGQELMVVCRQAIDTLFRVLKSSRVCFGAGCTEIHTAKLLTRKVLENLSTIQVETGCSQSEVRRVLQAFLCSIADVCVAIHQTSRLDFVTDTMFGHLWKLHDSEFPTKDCRCACGRLSVASLQKCSWRFLSDLDGSMTATSIDNVCDTSTFVVLDELSCKVNSASLAIETAALLLQTTLLVNNASNDK